MKLAVVGAGYVGLVSSVCFAEAGHQVTCIDRNPEVIAALLAGQVPIYEPGLQEALAECRGTGRLTFSTDVTKAVAGVDAVFICVGTPPSEIDGEVDLSFLRGAVRDIALGLTGYTVVVTKSTVPVGTSELVEDLIRQSRPEAEFAVVSNPEFLREGVALEDSRRPNRIIVGTRDNRARERMTEIYRPFPVAQSPRLFTDRRTSELIKYASNAFLATKIGFINEISDFCEKIGADVHDVARGMGLDGRIGSQFLRPGPGFGGSCLPKDLTALVRTAEQQGVPLGIVAAVSAGNQRRKAQLADRVVEVLGGSIAGSTIAVLGLAFKPDTDDMREAPALELIPALQHAGAHIRAFDPKAMKRAASVLPGVIFVDDPYECVADADALVLLTEWDAFRRLDLERVRSSLRRPVVIDLRSVFAIDDLTNLGFEYRSVGRHVPGSSPPQSRSPKAKSL